MRSRFVVVQQIYPDPSAGFEYFRILETYETSNGFRSRICDGMWPNKELALAEYDKKVEDYKK